MNVNIGPLGLTLLVLGVIVATVIVTRKWPAIVARLRKRAGVVETPPESKP
jgi:hypothetical protein